MSINELGRAAAYKAWGDRIKSGCLIGKTLSNDETLDVILEAYEAAKAPDTQQPVDISFDKWAATKPSSFFLTEEGRCFYHKAREIWNAKTLKRESGWQPIESAPKDHMGGWYLMTFGNGSAICEWYRNEDGMEYWREVYSQEQYYPTHWMSLPKLLEQSRRG